MAVVTRFLYLASAASLLFSQVTQSAHIPKRSSPCKPKKRDSSTTLSPVLNPNADTTNLHNVVPATNVTLNWGSQGSSLVNVSLQMNHPTVLLEEIDGVATVDCEASSVTVTFSQAQSYAQAVTHWSDDGSFILVTNHLGDCDTENERGVFLASSISSNNKTLTIVASGEKTDVNATAAYTEITFSSIPLTQSKRDITINPDGLTVSNTLALPADTTLYSYDPYVSVIADNADLTTSATFSGKLSYSILFAKLYELSFDVDTSVSADLGLTVDVTAPYSTTFSYDAAPLTYSFVNVPGIISLGPALAFGIGADLAVDAAVSITTDMEAKIADGNFHIDFLDVSQSSATGWTPTFTATANISEKATVSIDPYVEITAELEFLLLGGLLDLSGGLTAQPKFNNDFTLTASQSATGETDGSSASGNVTQPVGTGCSQGVAIESEFEFSVVAFVTEWWKETLYNVTVPIADECYSWLS